MNKLNKLVTVMTVATIALGVNAGDMKKIGLANPIAPMQSSLDESGMKFVGSTDPMANNPSLVKTDSKEELQKELTAQLKGWKPVYQVNVLQKISGTGCIVSKKAAGITQVTKHDNQDCRKSPIED
jgi:hypothetical protein